jgi:hypothetical protein
VVLRIAICPLLAPNGTSALAPTCAGQCKLNVMWWSWLREQDLRLGAWSISESSVGVRFFFMWYLYCFMESQTVEYEKSKDQVKAWETVSDNKAAC